MGIPPVALFHSGWGSSDVTRDAPARLFYCLDIPEAVRRAAAHLQDKLRYTDAHLSFPKTRDMHLTLVFLGYVPESQIASFSEGLHTVASAIPPFELTYAGIGAFGPPRHPRVIWVGVPETPRALLELQEGLAGLARSLGIAIEDRPFRPHLTLARIKSGRNIRNLLDALPPLADRTLGGGPVDRCILMHSHPERTEGRYEVVAEASLRG